MTNKENLLRVVHFDTPERIPMRFWPCPACWEHYDQDQLQDLMEAHPLLFPNFTRQDKVEPKFSGSNLAGVPYTDSWGCVWETSMNGITGTVTGHPLDSWDKFDSYTPPDAAKMRDWEALRKDWSDPDKEWTSLKTAGLGHGHTFLRLIDIRGYEALLFDMIDDHPKLPALIQMVEDYNMYQVEQYVSAGAEWMGYAEDLGMQVGPMLPPAAFRKYIKPVYQRLMKPARDANCIVHMHSDGDIRTLADDLIDGGVQVLNLQDLVNGIDWIADKFAGKVCIDLDIDRQSITHSGTPEQIDAHIRNAVEKLGSKQGGLMMVYGLYPGIPMENIKALMDAMETYSLYYS